MARAPLAGRILVVALSVFSPAVAGAAEPDLAAGVLTGINRERSSLGGEPLMRSAALANAARAKAGELAAEAAAFPSLRPEHVTALASLDDLPERLASAGFSPRRATAHVVVADRGLSAADLLVGEPSLRENLLDPALRELGIGVVRLDDLEIVVAIVALSKEVDFATMTRGLEDRERVLAELLSATNRARRDRRRRPLRRDLCLERAAQRYADRMMAEGFYGHHSPEGYDVAFRVRGAGCPRRHVGENLARGQHRVRQVIDGWMESPEHRENLLQPDFRRVGFGLAMGLREDEPWILWVQVLSGD